MTASKTQIRRRPRPPLLLIVYGASMMLVALTAVALVWLVSDHVTTAAIDSSVAADRSLVRNFATNTLTAADLTAPGPSDARAAAVSAGLAALVDPTGLGIFQVKVHSIDGRILFSDRPDLRGQTDGPNAELDEALESGHASAELEEAGANDASTLGAAPGTLLIEAYLPIVDDGEVVAVFEIYRNAAPIFGHIDATRRDVLVVAVAAAAVLGLLLHLIFRAAQARLARQTDELLEAERRDALTGLLNHGAAVEHLTASLEASRATGGSISVALVDIDNFRLLNETHGHAAGDTALRAVSASLAAELGPRSILARYGPDELLIVGPPDQAHEIEPAIERLRERLAELSLQFGASERLPVTISAGIGFSPTNGESATELLAVATVALGEAKASGGNSVRIAEATVEELRASERSSFDVLAGLVIAVDTKDRYTKRHSEDVARYASFLAARLDLDPDARQAIGIAGLLHDVGKIGIPDAILRKPAALTADEYEIVKQHVALGDAIARDLPHVAEVRGGIRHHHERWDGTGYLDGLSGEQIPLVARLLAVADAFSAMTTSRPYRKALGIREALRRLEDAAGSQLDPTLAAAFVTAIETAADAPLPGDGRGIPGARIERLWTPRDRVA